MADTQVITITSKTCTAAGCRRTHYGEFDLHQFLRPPVVSDDLSDCLRSWFTPNKDVPDATYPACRGPAQVSHHIPTLPRVVMVSRNGDAPPKSVRLEGSTHMSLLLNLDMGGEKMQQEEEAMIALAKERLEAARKAGNKDSVLLCTKHVSVLGHQAEQRRNAVAGGYTHGLVAVALHKPSTVRNVHSVAILPYLIFDLHSRGV